MDKEKLIKDLISDEGIRLNAYKDHLGYLTIGIGRLIDSRKAGGITEAEALYLLSNDVDRVLSDLQRNLPWFVSLSSARKIALANMAFQLGVAGLLRFKKMLAALEVGDYQEAYSQGLDSKWAKQDTPKRAHRITKMILDG